MNRGFSLVELSIVLVILGLLTGGILAGQSLIRAAELRSITTERDRHLTAIATFRDKYFAIPGDFSTATKFWGDDNAACADGAIPNGTPGTCNGDGNGQISHPLSAGVTGEAFQAWKQLALAGLIEGSYSGLSGAGGSVEYVAGTNSPRSRISNGAWQISFTGVSSGSATLFDGDYGHILRIGRPAAAQQPIDPLLRPEEAWNIDVKTDDGMPGMGKATAPKNTAAFSPGCSSSDIPSSATYVLTDSALRCVITFKSGL